MERRSQARRERSHRRAGSARKANGPSVATAAAVLLVFLAVIVTFLPGLQGQFVNWDDDRNFVMNPSYRGLGPAQLAWMFTTFHLGPYQPLSWMSLGLDYVVWGMNPFGYHLTSLLLHALNSALVALLAVRLLVLGSRGTDRGALANGLLAGAGALSALVFGIHPLRVESVTWITERRDVLSGLFALLTVLAYLKSAAPREEEGAGGARRAWIAASAIFFALSLLSKASAMMLPLVLVVLDVHPLRRVRLGSQAGWRDVLAEKIPFAALSLAAAIAAAFGQARVGVLAPLERQGMVLRAAQTFYGLVFYLWKTIVPVRLSNLYEVPFRSDPWSAPFLLSALVVLAFTGLSIALARRAPSFSAAWVSYVLLVLPVSGLAHGGGLIVADRYTYLPCIPWAVLAGRALLWLAARVGRETERPRVVGDAAGGRIWPVLALGSAALVVPLAAASSAQTRVWRDSETLWRHALALHPLGGPNGSLPLGTGGARGSPSGALGTATRAADARRREYETRIKSLGERSAYWAICYNLAVAVREKGKIDEAIGLYARAVEMNPINAELHNNWGAALNDLGRYGEAERRLGEAVRLDPRFAKAHYNLGIALAAQARAEEALVEYRRAIDLDPQNADSHYNLGRLLADLGRLDEAASEYRRAIEARPAYPEALNNLGVVLSREGRLVDAAEAYRRALSIDPSHEGARRNLAQAMALIESGKR